MLARGAFRHEQERGIAGQPHDDENDRQHAEAESDARGLAEALGGLKMLQAVAAPYAMMRFVPTGGVSADNLERYLALLAPAPAAHTQRVV